MARKKKIDEREQQVSFESLEEIKETIPKESKKTTKKSTIKTSSTTKVTPTKNNSIKTKTNTNTIKKKSTPKKDKKINMTQEDMDKLCEVYDWYLRVKDTISYNAASEESNNKDVVIEERELKDTKKAYINVDRKTWEDFDVLCSNCGFKKNEVLTQIIKDFLREHRNLF